MTTATAPFVPTAPRERAAAFGLAVVVTLVTLASLGGMADRQYEEALVAQASPATRVAMAALVPPRA